ncbi:hypothetical protein KI387_017857, partial [Taxus chinensis]
EAEFPGGAEDCISLHKFRGEAEHCISHRPGCTSGEDVDANIVVETPEKKLESQRNEYNSTNFYFFK